MTREMVYCANGFLSHRNLSHLRDLWAYDSAFDPRDPFLFISWCAQLTVELDCRAHVFGDLSPFFTYTPRGSRSLPMYICLYSSESCLTQLSLSELFGKQRFIEGITTWLPEPKIFKLNARGVWRTWIRSGIFQSLTECKVIHFLVCKSKNAHSEHPTPWEAEAMKFLLS